MHYENLNYRIENKELIACHLSFVDLTDSGTQLDLLCVLSVQVLSVYFGI